MVHHPQSAQTLAIRLPADHRVRLASLGTDDPHAQH